MNNVCGAGMQSVIVGINAVSAGKAGVVVCGGTESVTHNPYFIEGDLEQGFNPRDVKDSLVQDGLTCMITRRHMGELAEDMARRHKIGKRDQDRLALASHQKSCRSAKKNGWFDSEIVPIKVSSKAWVKKDDGPRKNISIENFQSLKPAFNRRGTITAGNASAPSDGAAACLIAGSGAVRELGLKTDSRDSRLCHHCR